VRLPPVAVAENAAWRNALTRFWSVMP
jgi:hypothetical protein